MGCAQSYRSLFTPPWCRSTILLLAVPHLRAGCDTARAVRDEGLRPHSFAFLVALHVCAKRLKLACALPSRTVYLDLAGRSIERSLVNAPLAAQSFCLKQL